MRLGIRPVATGRFDSHSIRSRIRRTAPRRAGRRFPSPRALYARGHARAALQHHVFRRGVAEQRAGILRAASWARLEAAVGVEVVLEEAVERARNVAADADRAFRFRRDTGRLRGRRPLRHAACRRLRSTACASIVTDSGACALKLPRDLAGTSGVELPAGRLPGAADRRPASRPSRVRASAAATIARAAYMPPWAS